MRALCAFLVAVVVSFTASLTGAALAHEGHDHADAPVPSVAVAPRASARTDDFELVAALEDGQLAIYLDRFATNEPVADAQVEVDEGAGAIAAPQVAPGVYRVPGARSAVPGSHALTVSVQAGDVSDLLMVTLDVPAASGSQSVLGTGATTPASGWTLLPPGAVWLAPAAAMLAVLIAVVARRRRRAGDRGDRR
ncbi:MAG TPA: hypothetical protein PKD87_14845 [Burkholderiaceae bacterium]|nr:hypothetical protein [Anaerolineae bacterium]MEB2353139.1 hypothetical protein [Burkholderiaceae bacterium]HMM52875.1 hypothetical protein [Burkholderiaceae bacterium]